MSDNLYEANRQWAERPDDERFLTLNDLAARCREVADLSRGMVLSTREVEVIPRADHRGLAVVHPRTGAAAPTHWAFGQLAARAGAPASYLRELPAELAADCVNWGLRARPVEDVGVLTRNGPTNVLAAVTGPGYGRVWNADVADALVRRFGDFGDGVSGQFRVPGIQGVALQEMTKEATTLYASDRDMWVFLADEERRVEVPDRRDGRPGSLARGFFVWNSEVGAATLGVKTFLFDYVCQNRIVWGARGLQEVRVRHTSSAPDRFVEEVQPALAAFAEGSEAGVLEAVRGARARILASKDDPDAVEAFLSRRGFTRSVARAAMELHAVEEGRPVETAWDAAVALSAYARHLPHQDARVEVEERAGTLLATA